MATPDVTEPQNTPDDTPYGDGVPTVDPPVPPVAAQPKGPQASALPRWGMWLSIGGMLVPALAAVGAAADIVSGDMLTNSLIVGLMAAIAGVVVSIVALCLLPRVSMTGQATAAVGIAVGVMSSVVIGVVLWFVSALTNMKIE